MAKPITQEKILEINMAYYKCKTYSGAAKLCGCAATTVKKYIIPNFVPPEAVEVKKFDPDSIPDFDTVEFRIKDWGALCTMDKDEEKAVQELWNELVM